MGTLAIPASGLSLLGSPASNGDNNPSKMVEQPVQVMRLDLAPGVLDSLFKNSQNNTKKMHISFGRIVTLHCGNKPHQLVATAQLSQGELYSKATDTSNELAFTGRLSHKLAMQQAKDNVAETDAALAMLQSRLASHEKEKLAKQITWYPRDLHLPPPVQLKARNVKYFQKHTEKKAREQDAARRKLKNPPITASDSTLKELAPPTLDSLLNDKKSLKLQALRTPLIHLLAVRQVSEKFLAQKIGCTQQECLDVLHKFAREYFLDSSKWDLSDKSFKELDVWKFPYPTLEDRQFAIQRAISAFDRMRLGRENNLWQMLLPENERGQGKVLSKLRLNTGSGQPVATPRISVQPTFGEVDREVNELGKEIENKDRLGPTDAEPMARSKSHDTAKKTKISEKAALSKRLLSKSPKAFQAAKPKEVAKKVTKKPAVKTNSNAKSTEFVRDSDEEAKLEDVGDTSATVDEAPPSNSQGTKTPKPATKAVPKTSAKAKTPVAKDTKPQKNKGVPATTAAVVAAVAKKPPVKKPAPTSSSSMGSKKRISEASRNSIPMAKSLSRRRTSTSPFKPSPLGSSPPTNASDLENDGLSFPASSNSSTPLISQSRKINSSTPVPRAGTILPDPQLRQDGSAISLKRKANDIDSSIHNHALPVANGDTQSPKRQKTSIMSPPTSTPSMPSSSSNSDSPMTKNETLVLAQKFKSNYAIYERLYKEVYAWPNAPADKVQEVRKMHERLMAMKMDIKRNASS